MSSSSQQSSTPVLTASTTFSDHNSNNTAAAAAALTINNTTTALTAPQRYECICDDEQCVCVSCERCSAQQPVNNIGSSEQPLTTAAHQQQQSPNCHCHVVTKTKTDKTARNKLLIACVIALVFTIGEAAGGYLAGSLAIMTDAAHMLSDFASFLISLFSIWMASRPASKRMSFGWHRAEVVGAVISVLIIWVVTGVLVYEAVLRLIRRESNIDANIMLITAGASAYVNVFMCMVLHQHTHGHGHSHGGGHGHSHGQRQKRRRQNMLKIMNSDTERLMGGDDKDEDEEDMVNAEEGVVKAEEGGARRRRRKLGIQNINVRAAFIHTIGDLVQSIGVIVAGYIIWFKPEWYFADPICTFLFSILVFISTLTVLRDALLVLMEGAPRHIDYESVKQDLRKVPGVKHVHSVHIWSLTMSKTAIAAHLALEPGSDSQEVLDNASQMLKKEHHFAHTTLQVENYRTNMADCRGCSDTPKKRRKSIKELLTRNPPSNTDV